MRPFGKALSILFASLLCSPAWSLDLKPCSAGLKPEYKDTNFVLAGISRDWRAVIACTHYKLTFEGRANTFTVSPIAPVPTAGCDGKPGLGGFVGRVDVFCIQQGPRAGRYVTINWWNDPKAKPLGNPYGAAYAAVVLGDGPKEDLLIRGNGADSSRYAGVPIDLTPLNPQKQ